MEETLNLIGLIVPGTDSDVFIGRIKGMSGVVSQADTIEEAFDNLKEMLPSMLRRKGITAPWTLTMEVGPDPLAEYRKLNQ